MFSMSLDTYITFLVSRVTLIVEWSNEVSTKAEAEIK